MINLWDELFEDLDNPSKINKAISFVESYGDALVDLQKKAKKSIEGVVKEQEELVKSISELDKSIDKLSPTTEENRKELDKLAKQAEVASGQYDQMKKQVVTLEGSMMDLTKEQKEYQQAAEKTIKTDKEIEKLKNRLAKLNTEEAKDIEELKVQIQEKNKELRKNAKETLGVVKQQSLFSKNQEKLTGLLEQNVGAFGNVSNAAKGLGAQLTALVKHPIVLIIAVVVGALVTLFDAFKKTTGGAVLFEQISTGISVVWDTLIGQIGRLINGTISLREFFTGTGDAIRQNVEASNRYIVALRELNRLERTTAQVVARASVELAKLAGIRDDDSKSLALRRRAAISFAEEQKRIAEIEVDLARQRRDALTERITGQESEEELLEKQKELSEAIVTFEEARARQVEANSESRIQLALIELDIFEQELDLLLDIGDRQKTINEQRAAQTKDLEEQKRLFQENEKIIEDAFQDQIALFEELGDVTIDQNRLLKSTGAELIVYARELGFAERAVNRLREVVIEKNQADQDNSSALEEVNKQLNQQRLRAQLLESVQSDLADTPIIPPERLEPIVTAQKELTKLQRIGLKVKTFFQEAFGSDLEEVFINIGNTVLDVFSTIDQALAIGEEKRIERAEREIERLEEQKEKELAIAGENVEAQLAIEQKFNAQIQEQEERIAREKRRQAQREKAAAVISSIIDTALAVTKTIGQTGFFGIPLAAIVGAFGAAQTAIIAAQPIPQFFKGTKSSPEGLAWVGERGRELIKTPDGTTYLSDNKPQLVDLPGGSEVLTNSMTERMLRDSSMSHKESSERIRQNKQYSLNEAFVNGVTEMVKKQPDSQDIVRNVLENIPLQIFDFHKGDFRKHIRKGTTTRNQVISENRYGK